MYPMIFPNSPKQTKTKMSAGFSEYTLLFSQLKFFKQILYFTCIAKGTLTMTFNLFVKLSMLAIQVRKIWNKRIHII